MRDYIPEKEIPDEALWYEPEDPYYPNDPGGEVFPENEEDAHFPDISIAEIIQRLKIGRDYISKNISKNKQIRRHMISSNNKNGAELIFNGYDLRKWLMEHATFTRQTRRMHLDTVYEVFNDKDAPLSDVLGPLPIAPRDKRKRGNKKEEPHTLTDIFGRPLPLFSEKKRKEISTIEVKPFDFWDKKLYFPKEYYREDHPVPGTHPLTAENCYRDMFLAGAIKIQLGKQKSMFYIPEKDNLPPLSDLKDIPINDTKLPLLPAAWRPFLGYITTSYIPTNPNEPTVEEILQEFEQEVDEKKPRLKVTVEFDPKNPYMDDPQKIETALKKIFVIDNIDFVQADEKNSSPKATYTVHFAPTGDEISQCYAKYDFEAMLKNDPEGMRQAYKEYYGKDMPENKKRSN